ncbi:TNF receptor-associated factor family protein DDB_G0290965-like [Saccostrea cucullata]|uniref:TNF receptor-associated factor family protein DDB_G0290965-like n=1 Tax=Saccostrea cuccullata TaxID=36930 RepID=UPI002ED6819D
MSKESKLTSGEMMENKTFSEEQGEVVPLEILENCLLTCKHGACKFSCSFANREQFTEHLKECLYVPVQCPNNFCLFKTSRNDMKKHLDECQFSIDNCQGCNIQIERKNMTFHKSECPNRIVPCMNKCYGCKTEVPLKELYVHLKTCQWPPPFCKKCGAELRKDKKIHDCPMDTTECQFCNKEVLKKDLQHHYENCYYKRQSYPKKFFNIESGQCQCLYCDHRGSNSSIEYHMENCIYKPIKCDDCGKNIHLFSSSSHKEVCPITVCDKCGDKIKKSSKLKHYLTKCKANEDHFSCKTCERRIDENLITNMKEMEDNHRIHAVNIPSSATRKPSLTETMPPTKPPPSVKEQPENDRWYADLNPKYLLSLSASLPRRTKPPAMSLPETNFSCARSRRRFRYIMETVQENNKDFHSALSMGCNHRSKNFTG